MRTLQEVAKELANEKQVWRFYNMEVNVANCTLKQLAEIEVKAQCSTRRLAELKKEIESAPDAS